LLADVASEDPVLHVRAQVFGNVAFVFDGEEGDAAARVEGAVGEDALGGAGVDAAGAGAAVIGGEGFVGFEFDAEQNFGKQECGASLRVDEHGVFADPAQTCALGKFTFEDGTCVGVITIGDGMPDLFFDELTISCKRGGMTS
jgi:hypothetical protein